MLTGHRHLELAGQEERAVDGLRAALVVGAVAVESTVGSDLGVLHGWKRCGWYASSPLDGRGTSRCWCKCRCRCRAAPKRGWGCTRRARCGCRCKSRATQATAAGALGRCGSLRACLAYPTRMAAHSLPCAFATAMGPPTPPPTPPHLPPWCARRTSRHQARRHSKRPTGGPAGRRCRWRTGRRTCGQYASTQAGRMSTGACWRRQRRALLACPACRRSVQRQGGRRSGSAGAACPPRAGAGHAR